MSVGLDIGPPTPCACHPNSSAADMLHCLQYLGCRRRSLYLSSFPDSSSRTCIAVSTSCSSCLHVCMKVLHLVGCRSVADMVCFIVSWMLELVGVRRCKTLVGRVVVFCV